MNNTRLIVRTLLLVIGVLSPRPLLAQVQHPGVAAALPAASRASLNDQTTRPYIFSDPAYFHWGGTPVKGDDGLYHIFYDRWSRKNPRLMRGWLFVSEIAHGVATQPQGPYKYKDTVLTGPGDNPAGRWDAFDAHNAYCVRLADREREGGEIGAAPPARYYLYFIANRDTNSTFNDWYDHIVAQRIGVAVADSPDGPWTRLTQPACTTQSPLLGYVVNPAVVQLPSGRYLMLLKGRQFNQPQSATSDAMGHYRVGWALADKPTGPFTVQPTLLFDAAGIVFEDPCVFVWNGRIYAVVKDTNGQLSGTRGISWVSGTIGANGYTITWSVPTTATPSALISARQLTWSDGTTTSLNNLERPFILQDATGRPEFLFAAAAVQDPFLNSSITPLNPVPTIPGANLPFNVCIPLVPH
jgi:hypothetical protein